MAIINIIITHMTNAEGTEAEGTDEVEKKVTRVFQKAM